MTPEEILDIMKPDQTWRIYFGKNNWNNRLCHIRCIVDNEYVVIKYRKNFRWVCALEDIYYFSVLSENGHLKQIN